MNHRLRIETILDDIKTGAKGVFRDEHGEGLLIDHAMSGVEVA